MGLRDTSFKLGNHELVEIVTILHDLSGMKWSLLVCMLILSGCINKSDLDIDTTERLHVQESQVSLVVLGNVQDAGSPHIGCTKSCCKDLFEAPDQRRKVVSLGLIDVERGETYLFEATPDITTQLKSLSSYIPSKKSEMPDGIFLTHAHIGHYAGLMYLGKEAINAQEVSVYAMPRMYSYLQDNGPWSQLVNSKNILLNAIEHGDTLLLSEHLTVIPFIVPHRDEYSETVGYKVIGPNKSALFIPDINKWSVWNESIKEEIKRADYAFVDATFYNNAEINYRDVSEIPHPFVEESMSLFEDMDVNDKRKVYFIHMNHTNPLLDAGSPESKFVIKQGYNVARMGDQLTL